MMCVSRVVLVVANHSCRFMCSVEKQEKFSILKDPQILCVPETSEIKSAEVV